MTDTPIRSPNALLADLNDDQREAVLTEIGRHAHGTIVVAKVVAAIKKLSRSELADLRRQQVIDEASHGREYQLLLAFNGHRDTAKGVYAAESDMVASLFKLGWSVDRAWAKVRRESCRAICAVIDDPALRASIREALTPPAPPRSAPKIGSNHSPCAGKPGRWQ